MESVLNIIQITLNFVADFLHIELRTLLEIIITVIKIFIVITALFLSPLFLTWLERKVAAHIQDRHGPMRVGGFHGWAQAVADAIKLMFKEDVTPNSADRILFKIAPILSLVPIGAVFVAIPFGDSITIFGTEVSLYISDMNIAVLYILAITGLSSYGFILGGWASDSKYAVLGGLRVAAQMISYEVAFTFACVGVVIMSNSLSLVEIVNTQAGGIQNWNIFYGFGLGVIWFWIFFIAGTAEINRIPFDLAEDEGTLAAGFFVEYSSMRFSFFALTEYLAMISLSFLATLMFFGGWHAPFEFLPDTGIWSLVWFIGKSAFFIYLFMVLRFTLPRYRFDQLMTIGWKILIPIAMVNLLVTGVYAIYFAG